MLKIISIMMTVWKMEMLIQKIFCWWWCWCWWCWWGQCRCLWGILHPTWLRSRGSSGSWELLAPHNATALNQIIFINTYWKLYHSIQEWTGRGGAIPHGSSRQFFLKKKWTEKLWLISRQFQWFNCFNMHVYSLCDAQIFGTYILYTISLAFAFLIYAAS